jgi:hypothetical protein
VSRIHLRWYKGSRLYAGHMVPTPAQILKAGAMVFGLSAIALIALPALFLELLDFSSSSELQWSMRMIGITVAALAGNMWNIATNAPEDVIRKSARVMQTSAFALGVITLLTPNAYTWFVIGYAVIGFGFSIAYTVALRPIRISS